MHHPTLPSHRWPAPALALALLAPVGLLLSCDRGPRAQEAPKPAQVAQDAEPSGPKARARELLARLTPPPETSASDAKDRWIADVREHQLSAQAEGEAVGLELLGLALTEESAPVTARRLALELGAAAGGPAAGELLENLVVQFGPSLDLREAATRGLALADPARAVRVLGPLVMERPRQTLPPMESILSAYLDACSRSQTDPLPVLAAAAGHIHHDQATRHLALRVLGEHRTPYAVRVLEEVLVETTGNTYLRRLAGQSLLQAAPRPEACAIFQRVAEREVDPAILSFLADLLERHCP